MHFAFTFMSQASWFSNHNQKIHDLNKWITVTRREVFISNFIVPLTLEELEASLLLQNEALITYYFLNNAAHAAIFANMALSISWSHHLYWSSTLYLVREQKIVHDIVEVVISKVSNSMRWDYPDFFMELSHPDTWKGENRSSRTRSWVTLTRPSSLIGS